MMKIKDRIMHFFVYIWKFYQLKLFFCLFVFYTVNLVFYLEIKDLQDEEEEQRDTESKWLENIFFIGLK